MTFLRREATFDAREKDARYGSERLLSRLWGVIDAHAAKHRLDPFKTAVALHSCEERP